MASMICAFYFVCQTDFLSPLQDLEMLKPKSKPYVVTVITESHTEMNLNEMFLWDYSI